MEPMIIGSHLNRNMERQAASPTSATATAAPNPYLEKTLHLPCTATVSLRQPSLVHGGLTATSTSCASDASATATFETRGLPTMPCCCARANVTTFSHPHHVLNHDDGRRDNLSDLRVGLYAAHGQAVPPALLPSFSSATAPSVFEVALPTVRSGSMYDTFAGASMALSDVASVGAHLDNLTSPFLGASDDPATALKGAAPNMCCGPPPVPHGNAAERANSADNFLTAPLAASPSQDTSVDVSPFAVSAEDATTLGPTFAACGTVPCSAAYPSLEESKDSAGEEEESSCASPTVTLTPTGTTGTTASCPTFATGAPLPRSRSFDAPLPMLKTSASAEDFAAYRSRTGGVSAGTEMTDAGETLNRGAVAKPTRGGFARQKSAPRLSCPPFCQPRLVRPPLQPYQHLHTSTYADPTTPNVSLSNVTSPMTSSPTRGQPFSRLEDDHNRPVSYAAHTSTVDAMTTPPPLPESDAKMNCDRDVSGGGGGFPRVASLDTVVSASSSRSRAARTPSTAGAPGTHTSPAASSSPSATTTSITYVRKNVSLGALDFHGNPVTSLSMLLTQMSARSGDRDEMEQLDLRHGAAHPLPPAPYHHAHLPRHYPNHEKNTLSMQNLKAHTQKVGEMGAEDKIKRLRGKSEAAALAKGSAMLSRRRSSLSAFNGIPTTHTTSIAVPSSTAATVGTNAGATNKPFVGSLTDVLHECNFLSINDVIHAIAETHASELREAQQQLEGVGTTHLLADTQALGLSTADHNTTVTTNASSSGAAPDSISERVQASPPPPHVSFSEPNGEASTSTRDPSSCCADVNASVAVATATATAAGLQPQLYTPNTPFSNIDLQHTLSLAAAMTEVTLNLERTTDVLSTVSSSATTLAGTTRSQPIPIAQSHPRTATTGTTSCSCGDAVSVTSPSMTSESFANVSSDVPALASHTSALLTPVQLHPSAAAVPPNAATPSSCHSRTTSTPYGAALSEATVVADYPDDPLEQKVLRDSFNCDEATATDSSRSPSSGQIDGSPVALSQTTKSSGGNHPVDGQPSPTCAGKRRVPVAHTAATGGGTYVFRERASSVKTPVHGTSWLTLTGRYVPNWHGLSEHEELVAHGEQRNAGTCAVPEGVCRNATGQTCAPPLPRCLKAGARDDADALSKSVLGGPGRDVGERNVSSAAVVAEQHRLTSTAACSVTNDTVMKENATVVAYASMEDELCTAQELRELARRIAQQELLKPSTETEVTT